MIEQSIYSSGSQASREKSYPDFWRQQGRTAAQRAGTLKKQGAKRHGWKQLARDVHNLISRAVARRQEEHCGWILENARVIQTAEKQAREFFETAHKFPAVADGTPRVVQLSRELLDAGGNRFEEAGFAGFLRGYQEIAALNLDEVWALRPALQLEILERLTGGETTACEPLVNSLREIGEAQWKELFEELNAVDAILARDPTGHYGNLDFDSKEMYRRGSEHGGAPRPAE